MNYFNIRVPNSSKEGNCEIILDFIKEESVAESIAKVFSYNGNRCRAMMNRLVNGKWERRYFENGMETKEFNFL